MDIHTLNGLAGKRRARRTHVKYQPLAVGRPDIGIGEQVITGEQRLSVSWRGPDTKRVPPSYFTRTSLSDNSLSPS
ncbi:hypothetical protein FTV95_17780 [Escherichia coli]|nr:hypothetical protein FTV95_17780 [Escherichia coli]